MLLVIVRFRGGERFELTFTPNEMAAALAMAKQYGVKVYQPGALIAA